MCPNGLRPWIFATATGTGMSSFSVAQTSRSNYRLRLKPQRFPKWNKVRIHFRRSSSKGFLLCDPRLLGFHCVFFLSVFLLVSFQISLISCVFWIFLPSLLLFVLFCFLFGCYSFCSERQEFVSKMMMPYYPV